MLRPRQVVPIVGMNSFNLNFKTLANVRLAVNITYLSHIKQWENKSKVVNANTRMLT